MDQPDKKLIEKFRNGDNKAFDTIYNHYKAPLINFCNSIIKDQQEAESIFHEVFIKILKKRENINPDLNFTSYLFTAVKNHIFDYFKEVKKNNILKEKFWEKIVSQQDENKDEKEEKLVKLEACIKALSPKRREILELNFLENKSYHEIAEQLMISKNTVKNQLVKAKFLIRKELD